MRHLFERALDNPDDIPTGPHLSSGAASNFVIRVLGTVGDETTASKLRIYTLDPETGRSAVQAIRQINDRAAP